MDTQFDRLERMLKWLVVNEKKKPFLGELEDPSKLPREIFDAYAIWCEKLNNELPDISDILEEK